jgi:hypothetical protein
MVHETQSVKPRVTLVDHDYYAHLELAMEIARANIMDAERSGDEGKARYCRGIMRGLELSKECYGICVESEKNQESITKSAQYGSVYISSL